MDTLWKTALAQQFGAALAMLENALRACPEALWQVRLWEHADEPPTSAQFWYLAYHTLFWVDLYLSGAVEGFQPPAPFTLDELDPAGVYPDRAYTQAELLAYLQHDRQKCQAVIAALTDEQASRLCRFPWGEVTFVALLMDNMRHVQEHAAQLNMILGQEVSFAPRWVAKEAPAGLNAQSEGLP